MRKTIIMAALVSAHLQCISGGSICNWIVYKFLPNGTVGINWKPESKAHSDWRECANEAACPGMKTAHGLTSCNAVYILCPDEPDDFVVLNSTGEVKK